MSISTNGWLVCPHPRPGARGRLFCFPHAGGAASMFSRWADRLPGEVEVWPVQYPGRETRLNEPPLTRIHEAARALVQRLGPLTDLPFAFFGHSLGAHLGFEVARLLRRRRLPGPGHLFASAARSPQLPDPFPPIYHLPDAEFIEEVCRRYGGIPDEVLQNKELMEIVLVPLRADSEMCSTYRYQPEPPLECGITVLGGEEDYLSREQLGAWREQTLGSFKLVMVPGGHFFIQPHTGQVLETIADALRRPMQRGGAAGDEVRG